MADIQSYWNVAYIVLQLVLSWLSWLPVGLIETYLPIAIDKCAGKMIQGL